MVTVNRFEDSLTTENAYLVTDGTGGIVIDPGQGEEIVNFLKDQKICLDSIILTHEHCDHMAGLEALKNAFPDTPVIASAACSRNLSDTKLNMSGRMDLYLLFLNKQAAKQKYPKIVYGRTDIEIAENSELFWRDHKLEFTLLPGHTPGSMGILLDGEHFFSGDYLIRDQKTITRFPGGDETVYEQVTRPFLKKLKKQTHIWPGHGTDYIWEGV